MSLIPLLLLHTALSNSNRLRHQIINRSLLSFSSREDHESNTLDEKENLSVNSLDCLNFNYNFKWLIRRVILMSFAICPWGTRGIMLMSS